MLTLSYFISQNVCVNLLWGGELIVHDVSKTFPKSVLQQRSCEPLLQNTTSYTRVFKRKISLKITTNVACFPSVVIQYVLSLNQQLNSKMTLR